MAASPAAFLLDVAWWAGQAMVDGPHAGKVWWGWGLVSDMRAEIERRLKHYHGEPLIRPPSIQELAPRLPPPRITPEALPRTLRRLCSTSAADRLFHSAGRDATDMLRNVRGCISELHDFVAYPETEEEVLMLLQECSSLRIAVVPFGGGSSVVWGVAAPALEGRLAGSVALDLAKMCRLREAGTHRRAATLGLYRDPLEPGPAAARSLPYLSCA